MLLSTKGTGVMRSRKVKEIKLWTVRNSSGQKVATYRAMTEAGAIQRFWDDQATYFGSFRGQQIKRDEMTAKVEE